MTSINERIRVAAIYNPQNQTKAELIDSFVVRQNTFQRLFKAIKEAKMEVPEQHYLILGRRGMGKTTLLLRLAYEIENDPALNGWLIPLVFNEEEYGIRRLFNFWERIMGLLEHQLPEFRFEETELRRLSAQYKDDDTYERALFNWLEKELKRSGKKVILFIDNFGDMTSKLTDEEAHRLRKILQTSPDIRIFAASAVVMETFYRYDHPFYEFFKVIELKGLDKNETRDLLLRLAQHYKKDAVTNIVEQHPGRVEALRRITGGVIRTIVLLFEIFADDDDGSAFKDLEVVLDRVTPLYKHRMDDLSDQQQAIVEAIALNWDALSVKEITERTRLESKIISAQLQSLEKNGIIQKIPTKTKNHLYIVAERFFNVWYLMRNGRRSDEKRVLWLVRFFEDWCDDDMMKNRAELHRMALQKGGFDPDAAFTYTQAMAQTQKLSASDRHELLRDTRTFLLETSPDLAKDLMPSELEQAYEALVLCFSGQQEAAIGIIMPLCRRLFNKEMADRIDQGDVTADSSTFWAKEMLNISSRVGYHFSMLKIPDIEKAEQCWLWAATAGHSKAMANLGWLFQEKKKDVKKAIEWFEKAAEKGEPIVMYRLGLIFKNEKKNIEKAIQWFEKAAENEDSRAMFNLGLIFKNEKKNIKKAIEWYKKAAEKGESSAMYNLGLIYKNEKKNTEKAIQWLEKAAEKGESSAMFSLGLIYKNEKIDIEKAIQWYEKAAEKGELGSMNNLGVIFQNEKQDIKKAIQWYEKAVEKGYSTAMSNLGGIFHHEKKDIKKAIQWYVKAAEKGHSTAMNNLGGIFQHEKKDIKKAIQWYEKAAEKGHSKAMGNLGVIFHDKNDIEKAIQWYEKAAENGESGAMFNLALIFQNDKNDIEKAIQWYEKAAEKGELGAMFNLGVTFQNDKNDIEKAIEWYKKAAEKGHAVAMIQLAVFFEKEGRNRDLSYEWYEKAAIAGNSEGMNGAAWSLYERHEQKGLALKWIKALDLNSENDWLRHTAACVFAWNGLIIESKGLVTQFIRNREFLERESDNVATYFTLMLAKNESQWLLDLFTSPDGETAQLKDRFKPIYYAILKTLDHPDALRMGEELLQTVDEILAKAKQMAVDYA